ncbi:MAG: hypothetical protein IT378_03135, partial [Sandaracinaceae bacterium]|nr:hypothetical protein [Sandaracinaceae bacterium]
MPSPAGRLREALAAWRDDEARETLARWRGDPDAASALEVAERHAGLLGPRGQELFAEAAHRGEPAAELADHLADLAREPALARLASRRAELARAPLAVAGAQELPAATLARFCLEPRASAREPLERALSRWWRDHALADREALAELEAASERAAWAAARPEPDASEPAAAALERTGDALREALARVAHALGMGEPAHVR